MLAVRRASRRTFPFAAVAAMLLAFLVAVPALQTRTAGAGNAPVFTEYAAPSVLRNANNSGEPTIGVNWRTGAAMYQSSDSTYRVTFDDTTSPPAATWTDVTPATGLPNVDPILYTDSATGRTFAGGLEGECTVLYRTDSDGKHWDPMGNMCTGTYDHETIVAGPWAYKPRLALDDRAVYYCAQEIADGCAVSSNGGKTFGTITLASTGLTQPCAAQHGHLKVAGDGTVYLPSGNCSGQVGVMVSTDNAKVWTTRLVPGSTEAPDGFDPSVATTPDNTVYMGWMQGNYHPYVGRSTDRGATWDRIKDLSTTTSPPVLSSTFQNVVAGDNGRVAVTYLGSTTGGDPFKAGWSGDWYYYISQSFDGGLTWTTTRLTKDPVQRGWICSAGVSCPNAGTGNRNLLDFNDAQVTRDGRVIISYADGCIGACALPSGTAAMSTSVQATILRQTSGRSLFAAYDNSGVTVPSAPTLSATASSGAASLSWAAPADGNSPITGYKVYRGTSPGTETALTTLPGSATSYADTGLTNGSTYYYKLSAINAVGESVQSNEVAVTPATVAASTAQTLLFDQTNASCTTGGTFVLDDKGTGVSCTSVPQAGVDGVPNLVNLSDDYDAVQSVLGFTIDGTKRVTGTVYLTSVLPGALGGKVTVTINDTTIGTASGSGLITASGGKVAIPIDLAVPAALNGAVASSVRAHVEATTNTTSTASVKFPESKIVIAGRTSNVSTIPGAPVLSATSTASSAQLSWTVPSNGGSPITSYRVYRGTSAGNLAQIGTAATNAFTDTGLTTGATYYYAVTAENAIGQGPLSNTVAVTPGANAAPTACFSTSVNTSTVSTDGACSVDSDGTIASYSWSWGDGSPASTGQTASHSYASNGTKTITLTVTDDAGATTSTVKTVSIGGDPDPSTTTLTSGQAKADNAGATGTYRYFKVQVPAGATSLSVALSGPSCTGGPTPLCDPDLDLFVQKGHKPTDTDNTGDAPSFGSAETVTVANPGADYWYVGVYSYNVSAPPAPFTVTATVS